jgi:hypothetical protein
LLTLVQNKERTALTAHKILVVGTIVGQAKTLYEDCNPEIANRSYDTAEH